MVIKLVDTMENIRVIHKQIYMNNFPEESLKSKEIRGLNVLKYEFWDEDKIIGYCTVVDKKSEKCLHA